MKKNLIISKNQTVVAVLLLCLIVLIAATSATIANEEDIAYPDGFRNWVLVKAVLIQKGNPAFAHYGGLDHIFANGKAIEGYKAGKFPDGSTIVFDVAEVSSKDSIITEGKRRLIDVMVKNTKMYSTTGGWGFEEFPGDSKTERAVGLLAVKACYNCHAKQKDNDFVFTKLNN